MIVTYLRKNDLNDNSLKKWSILNQRWMKGYLGTNIWMKAIWKSIGGPRVILYHLQ